jgi:ABC-type dipeptide/oligopeptide/nickel transport system ATPase component
VRRDVGKQLRVLYLPPLHLSSGDVRIEGKSIIGMNVETKRREILGRNIAMIPQGALNSRNPTRIVTTGIHCVRRSARPRHSRLDAHVILGPPRARARCLSAQRNARIRTDARGHRRTRGVGCTCSAPGSADGDLSDLGRRRRRELVKAECALSIAHVNAVQSEAVEVDV